MSKIELYSYFASSCTFRLRIMLNHKGVEYNMKYVNLKAKEHFSEDFSKVNSMNQVPSIRLDGITISQSMAIAEYLEETRPTEPPMLPKEPKIRAIVQEIAEIINSGTQPNQNLGLINRIEELGGVDAKMAWIEKALFRGLKAAEVLVEKYGGKYAVGDDLTIADAFLYPQLYSAAVRFGLDVEKNCPVLYRLYKTLSEHPAVIAASPGQQKDSPDA
mmetsp:Transcript_10438/g.15130  ORF Transcript_10438/g.15130 Transcript_10438/m.15130 type:complete len:217 (-) Transcript_10438:1241-1891(-)